MTIIFSFQTQYFVAEIGLLAVWFQKADTVTAVFATDFTTDFPFDPQELFVFAIMGYVNDFKSKKR